MSAGVTGQMDKTLFTLGVWGTVATRAVKRRCTARGMGEVARTHVAPSATGQWFHSSFQRRFKFSSRFAGGVPDCDEIDMTRIGRSWRRDKRTPQHDRPVVLLDFANLKHLINGTRPHSQSRKLLGPFNHCSWSRTLRTEWVVDTPSERLRPCTSGNSHACLFVPPSSDFVCL